MGRLGLTATVGAAGGALSGWMVGVSAVGAPSLDARTAVVIGFAAVGALLGAAMATASRLAWRWIDARPR